MPQEAPDNRAVKTDNLSTWRYNWPNLVIPILFFALLLITQITTQVLLAREGNEPRIINIAGRQRMLSQNISKTALKIQVATNDVTRNQTKTDLSALLDLFEKSQFGLQYGDPDLGIPSQTNSKEVAALFGAIAPAYDAIRTAARCLVTSTTGDCRGLPNSYVNVILTNENDFLAGMNNITFQYDAEASAHISQAQLILFGLFVAILILFGIFGSIFLRPLAQRQAETLEELRRSRTSLQAAVIDSEIRSTELQTVVDVGTQVSTILEVERLLRDVSDLTKERLRLYHSHIYLLNSAADTMVLAAGSGAVGRQMVAEKRAIGLDNAHSIVATAARTRKEVIANDVRQSSTFLPHPLLPDTRSELATPLIARGELIGVIDVQSDMVDFFSPSKVSVVELMAAQVAIAISNARLYETSERISRRERALGTIDRKIQGAVSMDEILQTTVRELGKALRVPYTAIELQMSPKSDAGTEEAAL